MPVFSRGKIGFAAAFPVRAARLGDAAAARFLLEQEHLTTAGVPSLIEHKIDWDGFPAPSPFGGGYFVVYYYYP